MFALVERLLLIGALVIFLLYYSNLCECCVTESQIVGFAFKHNPNLCIFMIYFRRFFRSINFVFEKRFFLDDSDLIA